MEYAKKRLTEEFEEGIQKELDEKIKTIIDGKEEKDLTDEQK